MKELEFVSKIGSEYPEWGLCARRHLAIRAAEPPREPYVPLRAQRRENIPTPDIPIKSLPQTPPGPELSVLL